MATAREQRLIELMVKATGDADIKRLGKELLELRKSAQASEKSLKDMQSKMQSFTAGFQKVAAGVAAAAAGFYAIKGALSGMGQSLQQMDDISKTAQSLGIAAEDLQRLTYAADLSGVAFEDVRNTMVRFSRNVENLADAAAPATKILRQLGVEAGGATLDNLRKVSDQFKAMPDGAEKTALAVELFGRSGAMMIPLLNQGAEGLAKMAAEADRLGIVLSEDTVQAAEAFNDNLNRLGKAMDGARKQIIAGMLPALVEVTNALVDSVNAGDGFTGVGEAMGDVIVWVSRKFIEFQGIIRGLQAVFSRFLSGIDQLKSGEFKAAMAEWAVGMQDFRRETQKAAAASAELNDKYERTKREGVAAPNVGGGTYTDPRLDMSKPQKEAVDKAAQELERYAEALRRAHDPLYAYQQDLAKLNDAMLAGKLSQEVYNAELAKLQKTFTDAAYPIDQAAEALKRAGEALTLQLDPIAAYQAEVARLGELLEAQAISADIYAEAMRRAGVALGESMADPKQMERIQEMQNTLNGWATSFGEALGGVVTGTEKAGDAFKAFAKQIIQQLVAMIAQVMIARALGVPVPSGSLFGAADGAAFSGGKVLPFARGGVVTGPTGFALAGGRMGVMGEAGPEAIMPLRRGSNGRLGVEASAPVVNVINQAGAQVDVRRDQGGALEIIVAAKNAAVAEVTRGVRSGYGPTASALQSTYGLRRR